tara:strand:+ start:4016 stop:4180 length:165 start_codon:yes stop_codon:yes gene_type:complete
MVGFYLAAVRPVWPDPVTVSNTANRQVEAGLPVESFVISEWLGFPALRIMLPHR